MESNGFGSYINGVVVRVSKEDGDKTAELFKGTATELSPEGDDRVFLWHRQATRRRDDEGVVFELSLILGAKVGWEVDWDRSDY